MDMMRVMLAGFLASIVMVIFMETLYARRWANADMVRAVGSILTRKYEGSFFPGLILHFIIGSVIALGYAWLLRIAPVNTVYAQLVVFTVMGFFHGMMVGWLLVVAVAEYHPVKQFQKAGTSVVLSHIAGHVVYGFSLGCLFLALGVHLTPGLPQ